jgi:hypothetical protein
MVVDSEADKAVNVILRHARSESDQEGGQIAVLEVNQLLRIRGSTNNKYFQPCTRESMRIFDGRMAFVPEGQADRSLARSAWDNATP